MADEMTFDLQPCSLDVVRTLCEAHHGYAGAGGVATYAWAVLENGAPVAAYAWQPPPPGAARSICPEAPHAVLALSRMVAVPKEARRLKHVSKPLRVQMKRLVDRTRWPVLVTYSDEGQGHTGYVYKCSGWEPTLRSHVPGARDGRWRARVALLQRAHGWSGARRRGLDHRSAVGALGVRARRGRSVAQRLRVAPRARQSRLEVGRAGLHVGEGVNQIAGISGGRTSGMMAFIVPSDTVLSFQNTGREHPKTYDFLLRLEDALQRPIVRLEFRAPARGEPPRRSSFEVVEHRHLARRGEPFIDMLECLRTFRAKHKGLGPVAPWAKSRICTSYLKIKTQRAWCAAQGWGDSGDYIEYIGLRADEPERVARMRERNDKRGGDERAPLYDKGLRKADVMSFWSRHPFDLEIDEALGNCTGCFMKDEADLATALLDPASDAAWWIDIERRYGPMRRGGRPSYAQVLAEAPERMKVRHGEPADLPPRRLKLVVRQEQERLFRRSAFSCERDAAKLETDDELEERLLGGTA